MYVGSFFYSIILVVFYVNSFASSFGSERDDRVDVSAHITLPTAITLREEILEKGFKDCLVQIRQLVATHPIQHCFLSYVNEDPDMLWMRRIESYLREVGVQSTYDMRVLGVGDSIMDFIQTVREAHYSIVLFSPRYLINFERGTYIRTEADEILEKWRDLEGFVIPLLLAERPNCSIPLLMNRRPKDPSTAVDAISAESSDQQPEGLDTLYIPLTKGSDLGDFEESLECVFRILKERIFKGVIGADASSERDFDRIKQRFYIKRDKLPQLTQCTELTSAYGTFPQSLKVHKAFLDRLNETGESYVYTIFEQLFMDESNEYGFATLTLCALSGLGGVGKTTLATEFAYKYQQFYDFVYWMEGGTKKDFIFSCESLLKRFNVSISKQKEDGEHAYFFKVINLLNRTLSTSEQQWLLIVDNIEEPELVADFAPSRGHVLYTSRNRDWLKKLEIDVFKPWESVAYLLQMTQKMTCFDKSPEEAMTLAIELEHLPLALAQAVAYINMQRLSSFAEYLAHYQASQAELLARKQIQSSLNGKYGREAIVMTTWNTTMQHMSVETQQFMRYIAYVNPSNIQLKLFDELDSLNDITTQLNEYSMIKIDESKIGLGKIVSLHRLVQSVERLNHKKERKTDHLIDSLLHNWIDSWNKKGEKNGLIPGRVSGKYSSDLTALNALAIFSSSHVLSIKNHIEELIEKGEGYDRLMEKWKTLDSLINMRRKMFAAIICMLKVSGCKLPEFLNKGTLLSSSTMKEVSAYFYQKYPKGIKYKSCEEKTKFYWTAPNGVRKIFRELHVDDSQGNCGFRVPSQIFKTVECVYKSSIFSNFKHNYPASA